MGFKDMHNSKYGSIKDNPNHSFVLMDERKEEYKNGYVTEYQNARTKMPSLEQAQKRVNVYKVLRFVFLGLGALLVIVSIAVTIANYGRFSASSMQLSLLIGINSFIFLVGLCLLYLSLATHTDYHKCRAVILSQDDNE